MTHSFVTVPETTLPNGEIVSSFQVAQFISGKDESGKLAIDGEAKPWANINYHRATAEAESAGYKLITEKQWLAIAFNVAAQACNWTKGEVGKGKLFRGIRKGLVSEGQPGNYEPTDKKERRWLTLSNGEKICDFNGNLFQWVFDDVQGDSKGLTTTIKTDSISLQLPYPSETKGMGFCPNDYQRNWSGLALVRGGCFGSGDVAGVFDLGVDWPRSGDYSFVGFRCTKSL